MVIREMAAVHILDIAALREARLLAYVGLFSLIASVLTQGLCC
jgi:hypothetical protein